jgi:prepilin-type N-terminal cleavage/methylation domain-containing protein
MRRIRDDRGVTLIELLIVVSILGIIAVPLGLALMGFLRNSDETVGRLTESHDIQIAASYFAQDVASIGIHDWTRDGFPLKQSVALGTGTGVQACGPTGAGITQIVRFAWDDPTTASLAPQPVRVAYYVQTVGGERQLHRVTCGTVAPADLVLSHNVSTTADPSVVCSANCEAAAVPQTVTMTLRVKSPSTTGSDTSVTLTGQRRQS